MEVLIHNFNHALMLTTFMVIIAILVDYIEVLTQGKLSILLKKAVWRQYVIASVLASTPGCLGTFMNVSLYVHGTLTFGAIAGSMIATCGDEAFIMLVMFPKTAIMLFCILLILGIISSWIIDKLVRWLNIKPCKVCELSELHLKEECSIPNLKGILTHLKKLTFVRFLLILTFSILLYGLLTGIIGADSLVWERITLISLIFVAMFIILTVPEHYLEEHIWRHIIKKHMWKIFLWSIFALLIIDIGIKNWHLETFIHKHMFWVLLIAIFIGIIPISGPHIVIIMMFAEGIIPFSVLLASCIVQDGHGLLPLLSYTVRDSILIKLFNIMIGLCCGIILYVMGF